MSSLNPYLPPQADVADASPPRFSQPRVWSWRGRIGRLRFMAYTSGGYLALALVMGVAGLTGSGAVSTVVMAVGVIAYLVQYTMAVIQRSHDMDWSGWASFGMLVPVLNLVWIFKGGSAGANRFGDPPPPNTLGVKVLGLMMPMLVVLGILAAVALPAYQGYVQRAKQAQGATL